MRNEIEVRLGFVRKIIYSHLHFKKIHTFLPTKIVALQYPVFEYLYI